MAYAYREFPTFDEIGANTRHLLAAADTEIRAGSNRMDSCLTAEQDRAHRHALYHIEHAAKALDDLNPAPDLIVPDPGR